MSNQETLTTEDLELLKAVPMMAGAMVVTLGEPGLIEAGSEMLASARVVSEATERFPGNELIEVLAAELHDVENYGKDRDRTDSLKTRDPMVAMAAFVEVLDATLNVLDAKVCADDALGYKQWIMACAEAGAGAAKEGGRFGIGGQRISDDEAAYLAHLRRRLELP